MGMNKLRVIEFWGGPGSGKSTTAAALFASLKLLDTTPKMGVELVSEEAKRRTWELHHTYGPNPPAFILRRALAERQASLFAVQWGCLASLQGQVDIAISDSPLGLVTHYADPDLYPKEAWSQVVEKHYEHLDVFGVWVSRMKHYETRGRNETEEEARAIDSDLRPLYRRFGGHFEVNGDETAVDMLLPALRDRGWL